MPLVPVFLQSSIDPILKKFRRSYPYVRRYNNTRGLLFNESYERYARKCSAAYAKRHGKQSFGISELSTRSAQHLPGLLSVEKARGYSERISEFVESNNHVVQDRSGHKNLLRTIEHPLRTLDADFLDIFRSPELHKALSTFFRGDYRLAWVSAFRTLPSDLVMSSWNWHSDSFPPHTCKFFLHLTPATEETGATDFMSPADTMAYRRAGYFGDQYGDERQGELESFAKENGLPYRPYHIDVEPGDVTLFNMNYLHRAVAPRTGFRDVLEIFLLPNAIPWDEQLERDGIDSLECDYNHLYPKNPQRL